MIALWLPGARNPLTLLLGVQLFLFGLAATDYAVADAASFLAFGLGLLLAILCARDLTRRSVENGWVFGLLVFFVPVVGFIAYAMVRNRAAKQATAT